MGQTKRKRSTKHRGNAAGMIEARGRAGSKPADGGAGRRNPNAPKSRQQLREERMNRPPTWRGATIRAGFAAVFFIIALILLFGEGIASTMAIGSFVFLMYIPLGYFTDKFMYDRRMKKQRKAA